MLTKRLTAARLSAFTLSYPARGVPRVHLEGHDRCRIRSDVSFSPFAAAMTGVWWRPPNADKGSHKGSADRNLSRFAGIAAAIEWRPRQVSGPY